MASSKLSSFLYYADEDLLALDTSPFKVLSQFAYAYFIDFIESRRTLLSQEIFGRDGYSFVDASFSLRSLQLSHSVNSLTFKIYIYVHM